MSDNDNTQRLANIQEFTLRAGELGVFDYLFNKMDMSRPDILNLIAGWADKFLKENKETDWFEAAYYDEVDEFIRREFEEVRNPYIDHHGHPYAAGTEHGWPAGGGLHKMCHHNAEALYAYYVVKKRDKIAVYLANRGFACKERSDDRVVWVKGNTEIVYENYEPGNDGGLFCYMHTELVER